MSLQKGEGTSHSLAGGRLSLFAGTPASSSGTAPTFWFRGDISQTLRLNGSWEHRDENSGALDASLPASQLALLTSPVLSLLYGRRSGPDPKAGWGPPHPQHIACKIEKMQSLESSLLRVMRPLCFVQLTHMFLYRLNLRSCCFIPGTLLICSEVEPAFQGTWSLEKVGSTFF